MKTIGAIALLLAGSLAAAAQTPSPAAQPAKPNAIQPAKPAAKRPAAAAPRQVYDGMSNAERAAIQSDLIWSGDYNGLANGEFGDRSIDAVKSFQKSSGGKATGVLNVQERVQLAELSKSRQAAAGWKMVGDAATGARLGLPTKIVPQTADSRIGSRWQSARGEAQVETFRINAPDTTLAAVFEQQRKEPANRKVEYNVLKPDSFVISGLQGLKKFYVRAGVQNNDVRGITILYDQAMEGVMDPIVIAMSSAFVPFPAQEVVAVAPARRKVDYGTGIVVSAAGDIVTDRATTEDCNVITVAGFGNAERVAEDKDSALALIRLNGARNLAPLALGGGGARGAEVTLVGIADPQAQDGRRAVTTVKARIAGSDGTRPLEPVPAPGFSGAAAIDGEARFAGLVELKSRVVAGPVNGAGQAALTDAAAVRRFLNAQKVETASGNARVDDAKAAAVRVICVRK